MVIAPAIESAPNKCPKCPSGHADCNALELMRSSNHHHQARTRIVAVAEPGTAQLHAEKGAPMSTTTRRVRVLAKKAPEVLEPLEQLLAAMAAVGEGHFSVQLPRHWDGIAGKLADSFNT